MEAYRLEVSREVVYWESAFVEIEANSLEEARQMALADAEDGLLDFSHDDFPKVDYEIFEQEDE